MMKFRHFMLAMAVGAATNYAVASRDLRIRGPRKTWIKSNQELMGDILSQARRIGLAVPSDMSTVCDGRSYGWNPSACYKDLENVQKEYASFIQASNTIPNRTPSV